MALSRLVKELDHGATTARAAWDPKALLSPWQLAFYQDQAEVRVADAGRRTGKTRGFAVEILDLAVTRPGSQIDYAAKSETDAKELIWEDLTGLNQEFALGGIATKNHIRFANRSAIRVTGAKDLSESQRRWRGRGKDLVVVDEASILPWLQETVQQAIMPALVRGGRNGRLVLGGTPSEVEGVGMWEEIRAGKMPGWSIHVGTLYDNPHIVDVEAFLQARAAELGGWNSPTFQREYLRNNRLGPGEDSSLVYRWSKTVNHPSNISATVAANDNGRGAVFHGLPAGRWTYLLAVNLGHVRDASSILVLGITDATPGKVWLIEEYLFGKRPKQDVLATEVNARISKYRTTINLCDEGALGSQSADWLRAPPYNVPLQAADKTHALATTDALNAALLAGTFMIPAESQTAKDLVRLRWDPVKLARGKREMAKNPHSDLEPCLRYLWPMSSALVQSIKAPPRKPTVQEREAAEDERDILEATEDQHRPWYSRAATRNRQPARFLRR